MYNVLPKVNSWLLLQMNPTMGEYVLGQRSVIDFAIYDKCLKGLIVDTCVGSGADTESDNQPIGPQSEIELGVVKKEKQNCKYEN